MIKNRFEIRERTRYFEIVVDYRNDSWEESPTPKQIQQNREQAYIKQFKKTRW